MPVFGNVIDVLKVDTTVVRITGGRTGSRAMCVLCYLCVVLFKNPLAFAIFMVHLWYTQIEMFP